METENINELLKNSLKNLAQDNGWLNDAIDVACKALTTEEAIGSPEEQDYPIQQGKETMLQVSFHGFYGQAFSREVIVRRSYSLKQVLELPLDSDWQRAVLIASANAVFACAGLIDRTIHCKNQEPKECAECLDEITRGEKVALFGLQPRFLEKLNELGIVRCVDIDPQLIGTKPSGVLIEGSEKTDEVIDWADCMLVTGSATVNNTFNRFVKTGKPLYVFGTTGAAMSHTLDLKRFCNKAL